VKMLASYQQKAVSTEKGKIAAERVKAVAYVECSAKTGEVSLFSYSLAFYN